ncbi:MAG: restriction endonuclease subunit S [bacterium]|jgi:type I restriction enzyme S subunit|nr:restriction endonuclease subunit S [Roseomonas sp.]
MRDKAEADDMPTCAKTALVPKLRFPEFRTAERWGLKTLAEICLLITNGKANAQDHEEHGDYPLFDRSAVIKKSSKFIFDAEAVILPGEGMRFVPKYFRGKFNLHQRAYALMHHQADGRFLYQSLDHFQDALAKKAVKSTVLSLRLPIVANFSIGVPHITEQLKIAECLSSLDEVIAAQARKVEALKKHKKGLMQQLFPREGETQPRLRFPEFRDTGEWRVRRVSQFARVTTGDKDTQNKACGGEYPFFVRSQTVERIDSYSYDGEAVLTSGDGVGVGKNFHYIKGKFDFHQRVYCIFEFSDDVSGQFFYFYFSQQFGERVTRMSAKNSVDSVRMAMITDMPILLPPLPEQHKIVLCLSSLDSLIIAGAEKLEALKIHKKGLMQQLFPSRAEDNA